MYVDRAIESVVKRCSEQFRVVLVTGPRQVGKTTMLKRLAEDEAKQGKPRNYITLDNTLYRGMAKNDPKMFLQEFAPPILIDEIQYCPELLPYIKIYADEHEERGQIWLTGSQPFHLMKNVSESLAGRVGIIEMLGLSLAEVQKRETLAFMTEKDQLIKRDYHECKLDINGLYEHVYYGSLPDARTFDSDMLDRFFESYIDTYLLRDIKDLNNVSDELKFRNFMQICASLTGQTVNYSQIARLCDIDSKTAKSWMSILISSYVVKLVQPYYNNLIKRVTKQPVMHFLDTGLASYLAGWRSIESLSRGQMSGHILESFAYTEILKSYINSGAMRPGIYFLRTTDQKEIDLLLQYDGKLHPVEVKRSSSVGKKAIKQFDLLDNLNEGEVPIERGDGCVLCMTDELYPIEKDVFAFPLWGI